MPTGLTAVRILGWSVIDEAQPLAPLDFSSTLQTLDEACSWLPGGAYTTFRTYEGNKVIRLEDHFQRLEESARLASHPQTINRSCVRQALRDALRQVAGLGKGGVAQPDDFRFRLVLDLEKRPGDLYLVCEPLPLLPPAAYERGVKVILTRQLSRHLPQAKLTDFIPQAEAERHKLPEDVNETLMVDAQGFILEGLSSNFFAVKQGEIWTAQQGVLDGITRRQALVAAQAVGIPVHRQSLRIDEIDQISEAFITSASRGVLPVTQIGDFLIGSGLPGTLTRRLMSAYNNRLALELETI